MKKIIKNMIVLLVLTIGCAGCANIKPESVNSKEKGHNGIEQSTMDNEQIAAAGSSEENAIISVQEEIMDHFVIDAKLSIPGKVYRTYQTSLKEFDIDQLVALLMPDVKKEEIQIENIDGGGTLITYQEENLDFTPGNMRYIKDNEINYIDELLARAEDSNLPENKDLKFLASNQAADKALAMLSEIGLGTTFSEPVIQAFDKDDLADLQEYLLNNDEDFRYFHDIGKIQIKDQFEDQDETYCIKYTFMQDGIPVFNRTDPEIRINGGIDAPTPAGYMEATVYISDAGIRYIDLNGVVDSDMTPSEEKEIILLDGIKKALIKKYGDVILSEESKVTDIWLEYIPVRDAASYDSIELVPAWCCEFYVDNSDIEEGFPLARYADRFNAFTGEAIP